MAAKRKTRRGSPLHLETAFGLFAKSRDLVLDNIWIFAVLYFVPFIFNFHTWAWTPDLGSHSSNSDWARYSWFGAGFSSSIPNYLWYAFVGFTIVWFLFVILAGVVVQIMTQNAQLEASGGHKVVFDKLWATVKDLGWRMVGLYLLVGLYIVVGLILFIIPGLIMLRRYFLSPYVLLDEKCGITEAMEKSAAMTKPYSKSIWGIIGVMVLISLINIIPFFGWMIAFVLGMLYSVAPALRYQELKKIHAPKG